METDYIKAMHVTDEQSAHIQLLSQNLEKCTGVEFLAAVVGKCDTYPEIPWKAFALGTTLSALLTIIYAFFQLEWLTAPWTTLIHLAWVLGGGAIAALLTPFWPAFARLFLDSDRAEAETRQYAQELFLEHELFRTDQRRTILLLIGLFEHQVVILPDSGVECRITPENLKTVINQITLHLRQGDHFQALVQGVTLIEKALINAGFVATADTRNQIPDGLIQQKGDQR